MLFWVDILETCRRIIRWYFLHSDLQCFTAVLANKFLRLIKSVYKLVDILGRMLMLCVHCNVKCEYINGFVLCCKLLFCCDLLLNI